MNIPLISYITLANYGFEVFDGNDSKKIDGMFPLTSIQRDIDPNEATDIKIAMICNHYFQCYRDYIHPDHKLRCEPVMIRINISKFIQFDQPLRLSLSINGFIAIDPKYIEWKRHPSEKCFAQLETFNCKTIMYPKITLRKLNVLTSLIFHFNVYKWSSQPSSIEQKGLISFRNIIKEIDVEHLRPYQIAVIFDHIFQSFKGYIHPDSKERYEPVSIHVRITNVDNDELPRYLNLFIYGIKADMESSAGVGIYRSQKCLEYSNFS